MSVTEGTYYYADDVSNSEAVTKFKSEFLIESVSFGEKINIVGSSGRGHVICTFGGETFLSIVTEDGNIVKRKFLPKSSTSYWKFTPDGKYLILEDATNYRQILFSMDLVRLTPEGYNGLRLGDDGFFRGTNSSGLLVTFNERFFKTNKINSNLLKQENVFRSCSVSTYYLNDSISASINYALHIRGNNKIEKTVNITPFDNNWFRYFEYQLQPDNEIRVLDNGSGFFMFLTSKGEASFLTPSGEFLLGDLLGSNYSNIFKSGNTHLIGNYVYDFTVDNVSGKLMCTKVDLSKVSGIKTLKVLNKNVLEGNGKKYLTLDFDKTLSYLDSLSGDDSACVMLSKLYDYGLMAVSKETDKTLEVSGNVFKKNLLKIK